MPREERGGVELFHAFILLDGSTSMEELEQTGTPKHKAVAAMVQDLINVLHDDPQFVDTCLTIVAYDGRKVDDIKVQDYNVKTGIYYQNSDLNIWDPLIGHGGTTPIGRALAFGRQLAERWVDDALGEENRRAVIYLMSDGKKYPEHETDGTAEVAKIKEFNTKNSNKGRIRLLTVGYFQYEEGTSEAINSGEDEGRKLLRSLPENSRAYAEKAVAADIAKYIKMTLAAG